MLNKNLQQAIEAEIAPCERSALVRAAAELTRRYKSTEIHGSPTGDAFWRAAYLAVRLPATLAVVSRVFEELGAAAMDIHSVLDLGAGPGTVVWAAVEAFAGLKKATLVESDAAWIEIGRRIAGQSSHAAVRGAQWIRQDLGSGGDFEPHDLVVMSYSLGEVPPAVRGPLLQRALRAARRFLVVIEPGTMRGFQVIHAVRSGLLEAEIGILAPCPHHEACPLAAAGDWCHFAQRVERSSLHRQLKSGELGYEDEKFSYMVADKELKGATGGARIVRHPQKHSGHVKLALCTARGIEQPTISRSDKDRYKAARKAEWGDRWNF